MSEPIAIMAAAASVTGTQHRFKRRRQRGVAGGGVLGVLEPMDAVAQRL